MILNSVDNAADKRKWIVDFIETVSHGFRKSYMEKEYVNLLNFFQFAVYAILSSNLRFCFVFLLTWLIWITKSNIPSHFSGTNSVFYYMQKFEFESSPVPSCFFCQRNQIWKHEKIRKVSCIYYKFVHPYQENDA